MSHRVLVASPRGVDALLAEGKGLEEWQLRPQKVPWTSKYEAGKLQWSIDEATGTAVPLPKAGSMDSLTPARTSPRRGSPDGDLCPSLRSMKASRTLATGITVVVACFAGGFLLGRSGDVLDVDTGSGSAGASLAAFAEVANSQGSGLFEKQRSLLGIVMAAEVDEMPALLEFISRVIPASLGRGSLREAVVETWGAQDPQGIFRALLDGDPLALRDSVSTICSMAVSWDADGAWKMAMETDAPARRESALLGLVEAMVGEPELAGAVSRLVSMQGIDLAVMRLVLRRLALTDPETAFELAQTLPGDVVERGFYAKVIETIAGGDGSAAMNLIPKIRNHGARVDATRGLFSGWAKYDLEIAGNWIAKQPTSLLRDTALRSVLKVQMGFDLPAAALACEGFAAPETRMAVAAEIAARWFVVDAGAAKEWVRDGLGGIAKEAALKAILDRHGGGLELDEQRRIADGIDGVGRGKRRLMGSWVLQDPEAALLWAARQSEEVAAELVGVGFGAWLSHDSAAAARYMNVVSDATLKKLMAELLESHREGGRDGR